MAKRKFVKLGEKASIFFDPTSGLKVVPGQAVELSNVHRQSKRVVRGLKSGHLDNVDSDEMDELEVVYIDAKAEVKKEEENNDTFDMDQEWDEKSLKKLKVSQLEDLARHFELDYTDAELKAMNKNELIDAILADEEE